MQPHALCALSLLILLGGCAEAPPSTNDAKANVTESNDPGESSAADSLGEEAATNGKVGKFTVEILQNGQASHITVQHVLIGFAGSVPGKSISRSKEEAAGLAIEVLKKARAGEDFDKLVAAHTDDSPPGIYHIANFGQPSDMLAEQQADFVFPRDGMVPAFGDVGFPLAVGEVGLAEYSPDKSKYGWHIIKRLK